MTFTAAFYMETIFEIASSHASENPEGLASGLASRGHKMDSGFRRNDVEIETETLPRTHVSLLFIVYFVFAL